jgi:hypothetical protein
VPADRRLVDSDFPNNEVPGMKSMFAAVVVFAGLTGLAAAQAPVAVVEDVQGTFSGYDVKILHEVA